MPGQESEREAERAIAFGRYYQNSSLSAEFGPDALILFRGQSGTEQMAITKLLPEGFRP